MYTCIRQAYATLTPDVSFPIPNIRQLFVRIGTKKPTIFGMMDLSQGYHQAPPTFVTRAYGVCLPFGLMQVRSYFQEMMATIVLTGS